MDEVDDGNGGSSPFAVREDFRDEIDDPDPRRVEVTSDEPPGPGRELVLFSHVKGGPEN